MFITNFNKQMSKTRVAIPKLCPMSPSPAFPQPTVANLMPRVTLMPTRHAEPKVASYENTAPTPKSKDC